MRQSETVEKRKSSANMVPWWKTTTVYQIYPRSFQDSDGDGIGDLKGIISRLDDLRALGFETLWLSPFYPSPQRDVGYDISDYRGVAPEYGTLEDFQRLIDGAHSRGMKLVLDMVLNHTSNEHPWFLESSSSRDNPKRDWYIWRDGRKPQGRKPPNNWLSQVTGPGWHYQRQTDQWYWASFLPFQPDLNYRNPEVKEEIFRMLRYWLEKGVDGFRLDIIGSVYEDPEFRDNPATLRLLPNENSDGFLFRSNKHTHNHPDNFEFARELRQLVDEYSVPPRFLVGETFGPPEILKKFCGEEKPDGLHLAFLFKTIETPFRAGPLRRLIALYEGLFPDPYLPTWVFSNHDRYRWLTQFKGDSGMAKLNAALRFTLRGVPFSYYGEELGMVQGRIDPKKSQDGVALHMNLPGPIIRWLNRITGGSVHRDGCRTPMQWDGRVYAGFSTTAPWMPVNPDYRRRNWERQERDPGSILNTYRRFLRLRQRHPALQYGELTLLQPAVPGAAGVLPRTVLGYLRETEEERLLVLLNFSKRSRRWRIPEELELDLLESTRDRSPETHLPGGSELSLKGREGTVFRLRN